MQVGSSPIASLIWRVLSESEELRLTVATFAQKLTEAEHAHLARSLGAISTRAAALLTRLDGDVCWH
jgi:hypothetical protein